MSRRSAVVAVSTGLILSVGIPTLAQADTLTGAADSGTAATNVTPDGAAGAAASIMTVPADAEWATPVAQIEVEAVSNPDLDAKPKPKLKTPTTSRSSSRQSAPAGASSSAGVSASVPASGAGSSVLEIAARYVGVPYVYGGTSPSTGFDCSGFTSYVFAQLGVNLPHSSASQRGYGTIVSAADRQPGDLVWYPGHVAIYAGDNTIIDAPRPGGVVRFRQMWRSDGTYIRLV